MGGHRLFSFVLKLIQKRSKIIFWPKICLDGLVASKTGAALAFQIEVEFNLIFEFALLSRRLRTRWGRVFQGVTAGNFSYVTLPIEDLVLWKLAHVIFVDIKSENLFLVVMPEHLIFYVHHLSYFYWISLLWWENRFLTKHAFLPLKIQIFTTVFADANSGATS